MERKKCIICGDRIIGRMGTYFYNKTKYCQRKSCDSIASQARMTKVNAEKLGISVDELIKRATS